MPLVMLKRNWPGTFRRCVRDKQNNILETLVFEPGNIVDVPPEKIHAILKDMGPVLLYGEMVEGRFVVRDPKVFHFVPPEAEAPAPVDVSPEVVQELTVPAADEPSASPTAETAESVASVIPEPELAPEPEPVAELPPEPAGEPQVEAVAETEPVAEGQAEAEPAPALSEDPTPKGKGKSAKQLLGKE